MNSMTMLGYFNTHIHIQQGRVIKSNNYRAQEVKRMSEALTNTEMPSTFSTEARQLDFYVKCLDY